MTQSPDPACKHDRPLDTRHRAILLLLILLAAGLRTCRLTSEAFGIDELFSVYFATGRGPWETALPPGRWMQPAENLQSIRAAPGWWNIWKSLSRDTHPPLHALLLRGWMSLVGESDAAARGLSVVLSLAVMLLLYDAARTIAGPAAGLWAAAIAALAGPQIEFARECRSYMLLVALSAAAAAVAARMIVLGSTWRRSALFAGVTLALMLTHYLAVGILLPLATAIMLASPWRGRWRLGVACSVSAVVYCLAWGPFFWEQRSNFTSNLGWIADQEPGLPARTLRRAAILPLRMLFEPSARALASAHAAPTLAGIAPSALYLLALACFRRPRMWVWIACLLGPVLLAMALDLSQHRQTLNLLRYTLPASIGVYGLLATALAHRPGWMAHALPAAGVLACLGALPMAWNLERPLWRDLAIASTTGLGKNDALVVICEPESRWLGAITYLGVVRYADPLACAAVLLDSPADEESSQRLRSSRRVTVISHLSDPPIEQFLPGARRLGRAGWLPQTGGYVDVSFD